MLPRDLWVGHRSAMVPNTRYAILGLLIQEPGCGYELAVRFGELFGPGWELNRGQVYDMLNTLEREGLTEARVAERGGRDIRVHCATDDGRRAFDAWCAQPCASRPPRREALYLKLALARPQDGRRLLQDIAAREQACLSRLQAYLDGEERPPAGTREWRHLARELIDEATTTHLHAELEWLGKMRLRIESRLDVLQDERRSDVAELPAPIPISRASGAGRASGAR